MSPLDTLVLLGGLAPFDRLGHEERLIVASAMKERHYAPGAVVQSAGEPWPHLLILTAGRWTSEVETLPRVLGVRSLMDGRAAGIEVKAGADGVVCLMLEKGHFFTIANECPAVLLGLLSLADTDDDTEKGSR